MAASAQNPRSFLVGGRPGGIALPSIGGAGTAGRSIWFALGLTLLATGVASVSAVAIVRERATQQQLSVIREGMELLGIEGKASLVGNEFIVATTMQMYDGTRAEEVERSKEAFRISLVAAGETLGAITSTESWRPIRDRMAAAVDAALETFDQPRTYSELMAWGDEFMYDFKLVRPTDNLGEWSALLEVATWAPEASFVPRDYLDQAMARLWAIDGRAPADSLLIGDFQFSLADMRQIVESH